MENKKLYNQISSKYEDKFNKLDVSLLEKRQDLRTELRAENVNWKKVETISKEKAKDILAFIKSLKLKVQAQIQDDQIRVSSAKKDDLQTVIQSLKEKDFDIDLQFINFR